MPFSSVASGCSDSTVPGSETWERRPHWEIGTALRLFDLPRGAKIAGSGFPVYTGYGSTIQRSLIQAQRGRDKLRGMSVAQEELAPEDEAYEEERA